MNKPFKLFSMIFAALLVFCASAQIANACSCAVNETVDKDYLQTPNIVILKLQSVEKVAEGVQSYAYGGVKQSKLTVEKVFKGNLKVGQEMTFAQGGGADCVWTFDEESVGQEYLFYLGDKPVSGKNSDRMISSTTFGKQTASPEVWMAFTCSRSGNVKFRSGDIKIS